MKLLVVSYRELRQKDLNDPLNKAQYFPDVSKEELFAKGYIVEKSSHKHFLIITELNNEFSY